jgi:hypothetical protein
MELYLKKINYADYKWALIVIKPTGKGIVEIYTTYSKAKYGLKLYKARPDLISLEKSEWWDEGAPRWNKCFSPLGDF